jgi:hypothetical protein
MQWSKEAIKAEKEENRSNQISEKEKKKPIC